jgi:hypothetical protein
MSQVAQLVLLLLWHRGGEGLSNLDAQTLEALRSMDVHFSVWGPAPGGSRQYDVTLGGLLILEKDPEEFFAVVNGMSLGQYREWLESDCSIVCSATTKAGQRCTNYVRAGCQVEASEWLKRYGQRCANHGG